MSGLDRSEKKHKIEVIKQTVTHLINCVTTRTLQVSDALRQTSSKDCNEVLAKMTIPTGRICPKISAAEKKNVWRFPVLEQEAIFTV